MEAKRLRVSKRGCRRYIDALKERACEEAGITLLRITNDEVFGHRDALLKKVREGVLRAVLSQRGKNSFRGEIAKPRGPKPPPVIDAKT